MTFREYIDKNEIPDTTIHSIFINKFAAYCKTELGMNVTVLRSLSGNMYVIYENFLTENPIKLFIFYYGTGTFYDWINQCELLLVDYKLNLLK
jgi:hypothetical protein